ncbi:hypothetical protein E2C01_034220 [Portunus trituberculatus]|uniref:Uncharacterized protein n=1 Tax=Portunus trituberculatus TaxID=210409 RepID=A0A5B7F504_PORTR|nr:hypothetical protein [Portunus trituberculatus]
MQRISCLLKGWKDDSRPSHMDKSPHASPDGKNGKNSIINHRKTRSLAFIPPFLPVHACRPALLLPPHPATLMLHCSAGHGGEDENVTFEMRISVLNL